MTPEPASARSPERLSSWKRIGVDARHLRSRRNAAAPGPSGCTGHGLQPLDGTGTRRPERRNRRPVGEYNVTTLNRLMPSATAALALFLGLGLGFGALADETPLTPASTTKLPAVTGGDFDHFAVDLAHDRLFVPVEVYASIEVFELKSGRHLASARGVAKSPHKLELISDKNELLVADAGYASCKVLA